MDAAEAKMKLYELYLADLGRIGGRHETARQFYITVITAITGFLALAGKEGFFTPIAPWVGVIASAVGIGICGLWISHMKSFQTLFDVKMGILIEIEKPFEVQPFTSEKAAPAMQRRTRLTAIDERAAGLFIVLFAVVIFACIFIGDR